MSYLINRSDPTLPAVTVPDNSANIVDTSLTLPGRNYPNYGQAISSNFVKLLENFASDQEPNNPVLGQIWYHKSEKKLKIFDGLIWFPVNSVYHSTSTNAEFNVGLGDILVITDPVNNVYQLKIYNGTAWQIPSNVSLTKDVYNSQPLTDYATPNANLLITDRNQLLKISKSDFLSEIENNVVQTGMIVAWSQESIPAGWVKCDGTSYTVNGELNNLYQVIGTRFGSIAPGSFSVPRMLGPQHISSNGTNIITLNYIIKT